ncbi:cyclic lactone autoinducer peptide [Sedimentibacter sp.]|nr:cyclic lactone autoinducer peptide [Sedimentibacter sp.]
MKELKHIILKNIVVQIKKTAQTAAGTTSQWNMYQPKEPKVIERIEK